MPENINDVKTETASSAAQTDETISQEVVTTESSPESADAKSTSTDDIVNAVVEKHEDSESAPKTDADGKPLEPEKLPEGQVKKEEPVKTPEQLEREKKENERFDKHPRFKELNERTKAAEEKLAKAEPELKVWRDTQEFLQTNNITPDAYKETIQWRADAGSDDPKRVEQALAKLDAVRDSLMLRLGTSLPADLQEAVDSQQMTPEWAAQMAKSRMAEQGHARFVQSQQALNEQQKQQLVQTAVASWVTTKQTADANFKPSESGEDGLFEDVQRRMIAIITPKVNELKRPLTAEEMVSVAETAYQGAAKYRSRLTPTPPVRKAPLNGSSRITADAGPKYTNDDIIADVATRMGGGM